MRTLLIGVLAAAMCASVGCKRKRNTAPPEQIGTIHRDVVMSGPADPRHGSQGAQTVKRTSGTPANEAAAASGAEAVERTYKNCRKPQPVTVSDESTPEGTLRAAFEALLLKDDEEAFAGFYARVDPDYKGERDARRYWFKQVRLVDDKGVRPFLRLVYSETDPSFDVCERRKEGDAVRLFVAKSPPVGSNPPFVLHEVDGKWRIKNFTPF